jgi:hypothetical protein
LSSTALAQPIWTHISFTAILSTMPITPINSNMAGSVSEEETLHFNRRCGYDPISNMAANHLETA